MATARTWTRSAHAEGPFQARVEDIPALNRVFSEAFTDRYRRDGMVGVRVPQLNPAIWRYAIEDAGKGAMLWRDERGEIAAFNVAHQSGIEGWMGPLAVRTDRQSGGIGKEMVREAVEHLKRSGAKVIGLETMPRTMDNIGFYSSLGFLPGRLTVTLTLEAVAGESQAQLFGRLSTRERDDALSECRLVVDRMIPGYDFTREIALTDELSLGDTVLLRRGDELVGYALYHTMPLVEGRVREELRVLKMVLRSDDLLPEMIRALTDLARRSGTRRVAFRIQGEYLEAYQRVFGAGARVRWTDLRMALADYPERIVRSGIVLSNWEI